MEKRTGQLTKSKFIFLILIFVAASFFSNPSKSQTNQELINQQDWITRQQQNQLEEQRRIKEEETIEKDRKRKKKEEEKQKQIPISGKPAECFPIKSITLTGVDSLSKKQQKKLTSGFVGKCAEAKTLVELISAIQNFYNEKGFVTAKVNVPKQNIQSGQLELKILEGKIDEVIVGDNHFTDKMQEFTAFGFLEGDTLNLEDINQGIYQMNRLPSNSATMKIEPSNTEGEAKVYIANQKKFPARATVGYDNLGNDFTGVKRSNFSGSFDNLLFLNDSTNFSYSTNLNDDSQKKEIRSFSSGISIPFGYNTFSYDYSRSEFKGTTPGATDPIILNGYSDRNNFTLDRVLFNEGNLRIAGNASITAKESASYLNGSKIETSERKLTIGNAGFTISNYFKNGLNLYLKPSYSRGLKLLNAKQDDQGLAADIPRAQFQLIKLYASLSKRFTIPKLEAPILLSTEMDSQISKNTLFGSEQFSVGGYYSVRGFRENYLTGDSGYYFRNKANFNIGSLILPLINKENPGYLTHLNKFKLEPFYDYGHAHTRYNNTGGRLAGAGVKTIFESRYFNASLTYSWATNRSKLLTATQKENKMLYFEISASCC